MVYLASTIQLFEHFEEIIAILSIEIPAPLQRQINFLKEDFSISLNSFYAKDAIKNSKITKKTEKFAHDYFAVKIYQILKSLYQLNPSETKKLIPLMVQIQNQIPYSLNPQDEFKNPYPQFLLFSQAYHANHFSLKAQRDGVSGKVLDEIVEDLQSQALSPDDLRVNIYFAPFHKELKPFVYNNRTWVVFSKSEMHATRIVPVIPTQDLLNRINKMPASHNPSIIRDESTGLETYSLKPLGK
jgi:hypothetical protein